MISSATLFIATLALQTVAVLGAPIRLPAEIAPRSLDNSGWSINFAREESFPNPVPAIVARAFADALPVVKRETEDIVRRYPRRFIYEHLEKRGTIITEKVTVFEKTTKHDNPIDTVAYNNGQPHNANGDANGGSGGFTTTIGFSTSIAIPGVPTATPTSPANPAAPTTTDAPAAPTLTDPAAKPDGGNKPDATTDKPTDGGKPDGGKPDGTTTDKPADGGKPDGTTTDKPADGSKPDGSKPDGTTTDKPADANPDATATPATTPAATPSPDATTANPDGSNPDATSSGTTAEGAGATRREVKAEATSQPIVTKRQLAASGAVWAGSLRRRAV